MRTTLKWIARALGALVVFLFIGAGVVYGVSQRGITRRYPVPREPALPAAADSATIERGARLAAVKGCTECHGAGLGGGTLVDDPAIGHVYPANLTSGRGGRGPMLTVADWELAVRHGVRRDGSALLVMPAQEFQDLTDEDLAAIVAYARSVPPVDRELPRSTIGPVGRALYVAGQVVAVPAERVRGTPHVAKLDAAPTAAYGKYLSGACSGCHGDGFSGGKIPGMPPDVPAAGNLTPDSATGIGAWSEEQFMATLRTGVRPDGRRLAKDMPIQVTSKYTDVELQALYRFLRTLPATPKGNR